MFRVFTCLTTEHDWRLVILAGLICFLASLAAVSLFQRARAAKGRARVGWTLTAGAAAGCGIWATHFIAMLAYEPGVSTAYNITLTTLSLIMAVALTAAGLGTAIYNSSGWGAAVGGGILGGGIASMHYLGMSALELPGRISWSAELVVISVLLGMFFGMAALLVTRRADGPYPTLSAACLLAIAIVSHHFTAMGAVTIIPDPARAIETFSLSHGSLAMTVAAAAVLLLGMALTGAVADRVSEAKTRQRNLLLDAALNNMSQGLLMFDADDKLMLFNQRFLEMYRLEPGSVKLGCTFGDLLRLRKTAGTFGCDTEAYMATVADKDGRFTGDPVIGKFATEGCEKTLAVLPDGRCVSITNQKMPGGGWVSTHADVTDQRRAEQERDRNRIFLDTILENVPATLVVKDARDRRYVLVNRAGENFFGLSREEMVGKTSHEVFPKEQADIIHARDDELLKSSTEIFVNDHPLQTPRKGTRLVATKKVTIRDEKGEPQYLVNVIEDVTERKRAEARIQYMENHDVVTDLPNRKACMQHLELMLEHAAKDGESFAVLYLDIDRFKKVNDIFGQAGGDTLLREISRRLQAVAEGAFIARVGGDKFTVIACGPQPVIAEALADKLIAAAASEVEIEGQEFQVGVTIGVAIYPTDGADATTLLSNADSALLRAKREARGGVGFFEAKMDHLLRERRELQLDLRSAAACGELEVYYQPQKRIDGSIIGFEALLRWNHPLRGPIPPATFIPIAEESGLIVAIGEWVLREACREAASWPKRLNLAINLSPAQFQHGDLVGLVHSVLLETGLPASRLELEITENILIGDFSRALSILRRLKLLGLRIAMDDFGTGYSSLSYLQAFPFDKIKIDQTFVANLDHNPQSPAIIRAMIGLGHGLELPVLAEGVATKSQLEFLRREGCDEVQGFAIGEPLPIAGYAEAVGRPPPPDARKKLAAV